MNDQRDLEGIRALVTGATPGIGRAAAEELGRHSLARAGRKLRRLCNPGLPGHRQLKEETLRGTGTTARSAEKILKHVRHVTVVADWSRR